MTDMPIRRALISVFDKSGLLDLGKRLADQGVQIFSTGGSGAALREAGVLVIDVAEYTEKRANPRHLALVLRLTPTGTRAQAAESP